MRYNPNVHHRRSIRLKGYDYAQAGAYYVTLCVQHRENLFGTIVDKRTMLNEFGCAVRDEWLKSEQIRSEIELDDYVIMPNHMHGIVVITTSVGATGDPPQGNQPVAPTIGAHPQGPQKHSIGAFIAGFKAGSAGAVNRLRGTRGATLWHRNYHDRIIRDERELNAIREYIANNPARWDEDKLNPAIPLPGIPRRQS